MKQHAAPLYIGPKNAEAVVGLSWRQIREIAGSPEYEGEVLRPSQKTVLIEVRGLIDHLRDLSNSPPTGDPADSVLAEILGPGTIRAGT